jgi:hypothetical protein
MIARVNDTAVVARRFLLCVEIALPLACAGESDGSSGSDGSTPSSSATPTTLAPVELERSQMFADPATVAAFIAGELRSLRGVVVDDGARDEYQWIPPGWEYSAEQLRLDDVPVRLEHFDGGHGPASLRAAEVIWPFFDETFVGG